MRSSLIDLVLGKPLASSEEKQEQLQVWTGVPVLGLDALASTGYGPEAALTVLGAAGVAGLQYFPFIMLIVVVQLTALYFSYRQTCAAYPDGGGAYIVAKDNLGAKPGVLAAIALLIDYLLNVAVGIAAGIGAVVSAIPVLQPYTLELCLVVLVTLTLINLRGVRETGVTFIVPVVVFIVCIAITLVVGLFRSWSSGGHPEPVVPPPAFPPATESLGAWLLLGTFANALTAMTGVEAVSNGVPLFREPAVPNAQRTLTIIVGILAVFLLAIGVLCPAYQIGAMDEQQPGYQTVLSQLLAAVVGRGPFYYVATVSVFLILTYSAQTSFTDFPRVCRLLADDDFMPHMFAHRGRRLVYSYGIVVLAVLSAFLLILVRGVTNSLIPLFAVGAFSAFVFSQTGMVRHWMRHGGRGALPKLLVNAAGAVVTSIGLTIIIVAKFVEGAWMTVVAVPLLTWLLARINGHYHRLQGEIAEPGILHIDAAPPLLVIVPMQNWTKIAERTLQFALRLSENVIAVHVKIQDGDERELVEAWHRYVEQPMQAARRPVPSLTVLDSPYRMLYEPILDFVRHHREQQPDRSVTVVVPEMVEPHWYEFLLHNLNGERLRALLLLRGDDQTLVVGVPWHFRDGGGSS